MSVQDQLTKLGIELPDCPPPAFSYQRVCQTGNLAFVSGHINLFDGKLTLQGKLGKEVTVIEGREVAKEATLNCLTALNSELGSLDKVKRIVKLTGYVASAEGFNDQPLVIDAASELLMQIFGKEAGMHARAAVGVAELPRRAPVEIELVVEVR